LGLEDLDGNTVSLKSSDGNDASGLGDLDGNGDTSGLELVDLEDRLNRMS
jgi:hypothetical protein